LKSDKTQTLFRGFSFPRGAETMWFQSCQIVRICVFGPLQYTNSRDCDRSIIMDEWRGSRITASSQESKDLMNAD